MRRNLDRADKALMAALAQDGRLTMTELAQKLSLSAPTVKSRLQRLEETGALSTRGLLDAFAVEGLTSAFVGVRLSEYRSTLDDKMEQLSCLDDVSWAAVVTGPYDILVELVTNRGVDGIYDFHNTTLRDIGGIATSDTFVVMRAKNKWTSLPCGLRNEWADSEEG